MQKKHASKEVLSLKFHLKREMWKEHQKLKLVKKI